MQASAWPQKNSRWPVLQDQDHRPYQRASENAAGSSIIRPPLKIVNYDLTSQPMRNARLSGQQNKEINNECEKSQKVRFETHGRMPKKVKKTDAQKSSQGCKQHCRPRQSQARQRNPRFTEQAT